MTPAEDWRFSPYYRSEIRRSAWACSRSAVGNPAATTIDRTYVRAAADAWSQIGPETPGWDYVEIDTGHWPMFTKPRELAALLDAASLPGARF